MTEPTITFTLGTAPATSVSRTPSTDAGYIAAQSSSPVPVVESAETSTRRLPQDTDPELRWLASAQARRFEGHWVALDPQTGELLGAADTREQVDAWSERDVSFVFVEPTHRRSR